MIACHHAKVHWKAEIWRAIWKLFWALVIFRFAALLSPAARCFFNSLQSCATKYNNLRYAVVYSPPPIIYKVYPFPDRYASNMPYFDFLDRLSSTARTEGLIGLSLRWIQPNQQHGRRIPSLSSLIVLLTCSFLVSSFLTKVTQHIHSLRARGVRSSHIASAALSEVRAFRRSVGTLCTTPGEIILLILLFYQLCSLVFTVCWQFLPYSLFFIHRKCDEKPNFGFRRYLPWLSQLLHKKVVLEKQVLLSRWPQDSLAKERKLFLLILIHKLIHPKPFVERIRPCIYNRYWNSNLPKKSSKAFQGKTLPSRIARY